MPWSIGCSKLLDQWLGSVDSQQTFAFDRPPQLTENAPKPGLVCGLLTKD